MENMVPFVPQLTGQVLIDIDLIIKYLYTLNTYLANRDVLPDTGWSISGITESKVVDGSMSHNQLVDVVGTLVQLLETRGVLALE